MDTIQHASLPTVRSKIYYSSPGPGTKLTASVFLVPLKKDGAAEKSLGSAIVDPALTPFSTTVRLASEAMGDYTIEVRLAAEGEAPGPAAPGGLVQDAAGTR